MTLSVVVVGYGEEPHLLPCLRAVQSQLGPGDEVVLVDNGVLRLPDVPGVEVLSSGRNLGFSAGCDLGASATHGDDLVFVNSDAVLQPGAIRALQHALRDPEAGLVSGCIVLADDPATVNSCGNPVHVTGISWAGGHGDPLAEHREPAEVASVSGALFAVRREVWEQLGGFDPDFFMYYEDADLSMRCWLAGLKVRYAPEAVATHAYDFSRNPSKMHLLERNRLASVLTVYPAHLLRRALPVLCLTEPLLFVLAVRDRWLRQRLDAWAWLFRHRHRLAARRRTVQASVTSPRALDDLLTTRLTQSVVTAPAGLPLLDWLVTHYWRAYGRATPRIRQTAPRNPTRKADT